MLIIKKYFLSLLPESANVPVVSKRAKEKPVEKEKEKEKEKEIKPQTKQKRLPPADFKVPCLPADNMHPSSDFCYK